VWVGGAGGSAGASLLCLPVMHQLLPLDGSLVRPSPHRRGCCSTGQGGGGEVTHPEGGGGGLPPRGSTFHSWGQWRRWRRSWGIEGTPSRRTGRRTVRAPSCWHPSCWHPSWRPLFAPKKARGWVPSSCLAPPRSASASGDRPTEGSRRGISPPPPTVACLWPGQRRGASRGDATLCPHLCCRLQPARLFHR